MQDIKPIQVIYLGTGSGISHTYEESQVQDSFKVTSQGPNGVEVTFLPEHIVTSLIRAGVLSVHRFDRG